MINLIANIQQNFYLYTNLVNCLELVKMSYLLFLIGIIGMIFNYKNFLITMLSIELMYLGIVSGFAIASICLFDIQGQIYALIVLILAASESAVGLGLLIVLFRYGKNIDFDVYQELRG